MSSNDFYLGVDLGGTKISACVLDSTKQELARERIDTPQTDKPEDIVAAIVALVGDMEARFGRGLPLGIGTPGAVSTLTGEQQNSNTVCLNGFRLKAALEQSLSREVVIANDANCLALAESHLGSGKGHAVVFAVIIGTGVGGGLVVHERVLSGLNHLAGEWGHNPMPWTQAQGPSCYCGKHGCIETYLSGKGVANRYHALHGEHLRFEALVARALDGDAVAVGFLDEYYELVAKALASIVNVYDPDAIVLGGGVSNIKALYTEVPRRWQQYVFSKEPIQTPILAAALGDDAGVVGAALLAAGY